MATNGKVMMFKKHWQDDGFVPSCQLSCSCQLRYTFKAENTLQSSSQEAGGHWEVHQLPEVEI